MFLKGDPEFDSEQAEKYFSFLALVDITGELDSSRSLLCNQHIGHVTLMIHGNIADEFYLNCSS